MRPNPTAAWFAFLGRLGGPIRRRCAFVLVGVTMCVSLAGAAVVSASLLRAHVTGSLAADIGTIAATAARLQQQQDRLALGAEVAPDEVMGLNRELSDALAEVTSGVGDLDPLLQARLRQSAAPVVAPSSPGDPGVRSTEEFRGALDAAEARARSEADAAFRRAQVLLWVMTVVVLAIVLVLGVRVNGFVRVAVRRPSRTADGHLWARVAHDDELLLVYRADLRGLRYVSPSIERVLGFPLADFAIDPDPRRFLVEEDLQAWNDAVAATTSEPGGHRRVKVRARRLDGSELHLEADVTNLLDEPGVAGVAINARDISDRVHLEADLAHQATHDALTGLTNRLQFTHEVNAVLASTEDPAEVAIVLLDLDGFKEINDSLGHGAGDHVLVTVAARLATLSRRRDCVARLGGDEFAVLVVGDHAEAVAQRIVEALAEPIELLEWPVTVGASAGVVVAEAGSTVASLLRDADAAMYDAKRRGRNRVTVFEPAMHDERLERMQLRSELEAAIAAEAFTLVYQPKLRLGDGSVEGFEALIRWPRHDGSVTAPGDFIPVAELTGQIVPIGSWVLRTAVAQLAAWQRQLPDGACLTMAINVSTRQLSAPGFVAEVRDVLLVNGVDPATVTLEFTETAVIRDTDEAVVVLTALRSLGVRIAVDDYGSGHASIGYLRRLPVDVLKIDRSFVAALDERSDEAEAYLRSITDLARTLRLDTVAEGIEHEYQLDLLRSLGCGSGQGFHLARPLTPEAAERFLSGRRRLDAT